jgi:hypothetical protein
MQSESVGKGTTVEWGHVKLRCRGVNRDGENLMLFEFFDLVSAFSQAQEIYLFTFIKFGWLDFKVLSK